MSKTNYNDPTNAANPPGGKHHQTSPEGSKLPTDRSPAEKSRGKRKKSVSPKTASKAERQPR